MLTMNPHYDLPRGVAATATTVANVRSAPRTLVGTLVQPFDGCIIEAEEQDIDMDCLIDACTKLRDVMFSMGQDGTARDLAANLKKIQKARNAAPPSHRNTLRALLQYEKNQGVKLSGGKLRNPSAAMGLLWIRRSVAFQRRMVSILLNDPHLQPTQAAMEAYRDELEPYHSWGLQRIFKMAFRSSTPPRAKIMKRFQGNHAASESSSPLDETFHDLHELLGIWKPLVNCWKSIFESLDLEDTNRA